METTYVILFLILKQSPFHTPTPKQTARSFLSSSPWKKRQFLETSKKAKAFGLVSNIHLWRVYVWKLKTLPSITVQDTLSAVLLLISSYFKCLAPEGKHTNNKYGWQFLVLHLKIILNLFYFCRQNLF